MVRLRQVHLDVDAASSGASPRLNWPPRIVFVFVADAVVAFGFVIDAATFPLVSDAVATRIGGGVVGALTRGT